MRRFVLLVAALAVVLAACGTDTATTEAVGSSSAPTTDATTTTMSDSEMDDMTDDTAMDDMTDDTAMDDMDDMDMGEMNMGDADATPAADVEGAELVSASFVLLDTRPIGYDGVEGTADLARYDGGTTVTIEFTGLLPNTDFISHLHEGVCADLGGPHFKFDPDGSDMPPNEIHLAFTSDTDGGGFMTVENAMTVGENARSIVVHPVLDLDAKVACAEF